MYIEIKEIVYIFQIFFDFLCYLSRSCVFIKHIFRIELLLWCLHEPHMVAFVQQLVFTFSYSCHPSVSTYCFAFDPSHLSEPKLPASYFQGMFLALILPASIIPGFFPQALHTSAVAPKRSKETLNTFVLSQKIQQNIAKSSGKQPHIYQTPHESFSADICFGFVCQNCI